MVAAYQEIMHECDESKRLVYADSMIMAAKKAEDNDLIGSAYLSKGVVYYQRKQHRLALDNYLTANRYLVGTRDQYLIHKVKYSIAQIKYYLGYYNEAIALFRQCVDYYGDTEPLPYLISLHSLSLCYTYTDALDLAEATSVLALEESRRLGIRLLLPYIELADGITNYKRQRFDRAITHLRYSLPELRKADDFANEAVAHFYLGKSYAAKADTAKAVHYFIKVDSTFTARQYIRPDLRESYEFLIRHYHRKGNTTEQLKYVDRLLQADSILNLRFRYLLTKVHKEYDTADLQAEKKKLQDDLSRSRWSGWLFKALLVVMLIAVTLIVRRYLGLRRRYKERFETLLKKDMRQQPEPVRPTNGELDINPEIVQHIISKLQDFEKKNGFLKKEITATKLAESFNTNYKYLSKVIRHQKQKSFVNYINDLRIDYIVERLKAEPLLRKYTNGALADEAGFSTAQHFTTAFKKRTEISPGYFVEEIKKINQS
ncbi:helix-turn-helix domain-containing protein [Flavobacterium sp. MK4S-17]|uniref:helix-turn-helix domain-containing protein n=1 Tax=Flavobacterium sp. MK4S-17 TaxID=2543737 RepID=UPI00135AF419|nr:helix-turn-helix domain-containing protein [Flavobacterium sp. MK4S-17]